ncbi:MAG: hypothetical protein ABL958_01880 [Bdellovibrionia bacterium]
MKRRFAILSVLFIAGLLLSYNNCGGIKAVTAESQDDKYGGGGSGDGTPEVPITSSFALVHSYSSASNKLFTIGSDGLLTEAGMPLKNGFNGNNAVFDRARGFAYSTSNQTLNGFVIDVLDGVMRPMGPPLVTIAQTFNGYPKFDSTNKRFFAATTDNLGVGTISGYQLSANGMSVTALNSSITLNSIGTPSFPPNGRFMYVTHQPVTGQPFTTQIFLIAANGMISTGGTTPTFAALPQFDSQSRWRYSINGFAANQLVVHSMNSADGSLTQVQAVQLPVPTGTSFLDVRAMEIDKNDKYLYVTFMRIDGPNGVASVNNSVLMKFAINQTTGALTEAAQVVMPGHVISLAIDPDNKGVYVVQPDFTNNSGSVIRQFTTDGNGNTLTMSPTNFFFQGVGAYEITTLKFTR